MTCLMRLRPAHFQPICRPPKTSLKAVSCSAAVPLLHTKGLKETTTETQVTANICKYSLMHVFTDHHQPTCFMSDVGMASCQLHSWSSWPRFHERTIWGIIEVGFVLHPNQWLALEDGVLGAKDHLITIHPGWGSQGEVQIGETAAFLGMANTGKCMKMYENVWTCTNKQQISHELAP